MTRDYNEQQFTPLGEVLTLIEAAEAVAKSVFPSCSELSPKRWNDADMEVTLHCKKTFDADGVTDQSSYTARYIAESPHPREYPLSAVMNVAYLMNIASNEFAMSSKNAFRELTLTLIVTVEYRVRQTYTVTFAKETDYVPAYGTDSYYHKSDGVMLINRTNS